MRRGDRWGHAGGVPRARADVEVNFLGGLRSSIKDRSFCPLPVRERMIPKPGGKKRRLGFATVTGRVVQASLKLVLEPVFISYDELPGAAAGDRASPGEGQTIIGTPCGAELGSSFLRQLTDGGTPPRPARR